MLAQKKRADEATGRAPAREPGEAAGISDPSPSDSGAAAALAIPWESLEGSDDHVKQNWGVWEAGVRLPGFVVDPALLQQ